MTKRQLFEKKLNSILNTRPVEPRPYQERIRTKLNDGWGEGVISQLVVSPTGSGKTVVGLIAARDFVLKVGPELLGCSSDEIGVCWVAMRRNLLDQAEEANHQLSFEGCERELCPNVRFVSMFDKTCGEAMAGFKHIIMVVDEAHHDAASTMVAFHGKVKPDLVLGLSATPQRSDGLKICFQKEIQDAGYHFLIKDGYLSQFNSWVLRTWTPASVAALYLKSPTRWGRSLAFFLTRAECEEYAGLLVAGGVSCEVVHGGSNRRKQLGDFEEGRCDTLVSMAVLSEGFDCPSLQTVFVRDVSSKGPCIQMSGRVLRIWEGVTKNIVQSRETKHPFTKFAHAHTQFVEDDNGVWSSIGSNDKVDEVISGVRTALVNGRLPVLPAYFRDKRKPVILG